MVAVRSEQKTESSDLASKKKTDTVEDKQDNQSTMTLTNYEVSKTVESVINPVGTVKRLSVATLVDGTYKKIAGPKGGEEQLVYEPRPQAEIDRLAGIIKNAVGYSPERNDQVEVVNIAFDKTYLNEQQQELDNQYNKQFYYDIGKKVLIVAAVLVGLFFIFRTLKKFLAGLVQVLAISPAPARAAGTASYEARTNPVPEIPEIVPEARRAKLVDQMQKIAKDDPEEIARVIKTMMVE